MKKAVITVVVTALVIVGGGLFTNYLKNRPHVPTEFTQARIKGAEASTKMAQLVSASLSNLVAVEKADHQADYKGAIALTSKEIEGVKEKSQVAIELSTRLLQMAVAVPDIRPEQAREFAIEAISSAVASVTHLGVYSEYLRQVFATLYEKFETGVGTGPKIDELIEKMNLEAKSINELNDKFTASLKAFDNIVR